MKIEKIRLENIRSYVSKEIVFPEGKVLLWGNIGSGKSTILLAIDFVLFGLQRSELAGASLLRNGAEDGNVELFFSIEDKKYVIKRNLKRSKTGVTQDSGYIICEGVKLEKTALELKQIVLDLLHYPKELLTKNKALIYRYTVYTPQEEMKSILLESKEERLDTLRKVFGVDKYKRVKENVKVVISHLKETKKMYEGMTADLQEKILAKELKDKEKVQFEEKLSAIMPLFEDAKRTLEIKKEELRLIEIKKEDFLKIKKEYALCQQELRYKNTERNNAVEKVVVLNKEIEDLKRENLELIEDVKENIKAIDEKLVQRERDNREILNKIQDLRTKKTHSLMTKQKVESLNNCPTCYQEVSIEHKTKIIDDSNQQIQNYDKGVVDYEEQSKRLELEIKALRIDLEFLKKKDSEIGLIKLKRQHLANKQQESLQLQEKLKIYEQELIELHNKNKYLESKQEELSSVEVFAAQLKLEVDKAQDNYHKVDIEKNNFSSSIKYLIQNINEISIDISKKMMMREKKEYFNKVQFWLTDYFVPMMDIMEKNVLYKVHAEFNSLFEKWFSILIDNQVLQMSLDEEYSPKILQNGYDIEYEFLSGGEKTAGALAYRLALNQVINNMNTGIKTKDLLILDEPTDGFSHEQLDRLKILMDEIQIPQIIIVSHEPQIECFVNNVIRLEKTGHETHIV